MLRLLTVTVVVAYRLKLKAVTWESFDRSVEAVPLSES